MRILYDGQIYATQAIGGISRYFANLICRLPSTDQPTLTAVQRSGVDYPTHPNLKTLKYKRFRLSHLSSALERIYFQSLLSQSNFDLAHPTYYSLLTQREMREYGCPLVITVYDMIHERFPELFSVGDNTVELKRRAIMAAQVIIAISHSTKNDLLEYYDIPEDKIIVTHLATEFDSSLSHGSEPVPSQPYFLYVGGRLKYKNFDTFLQAFAKAASVQPDIKLCVTGSPFGDEEQQGIADLGLSDRIEHYGYASDSHLAKLYRCSVAFVYPSLYEGFGIPPLEAMACGGVVVASNCSSIPEVVGDAGILFDPTSTEDLADILLFLLDNPLERDRMIAKGRDRTQQFSWDNTAAKTFEVYRAIAN